LWRIRLDDGPASRPQTGLQKPWAHQAGTQCCSVPPSIRKINSKGTAVLNARRAGYRGKSQEKAQDYSGFGLKLQTPTQKSAQLTSLAPARVEAKFLLGLLLFGMLQLFRARSSPVERAVSHPPRALFSTL
jgi:hypothetical protein